VLVHGNERMRAVYIDKLDGKIGATFPTASSPGEWREEQLRLQRKLDRPEAAEQSYIDESVQIFELARKGRSSGSSRAKPRLLNFILSNCSWEDGEARVPSANRMIYWRKQPQ
jgi:site-specific DNA recombinase